MSNAPASPSTHKPLHLLWREVFGEVSPPKPEHLVLHVSRGLLRITPLGELRPARPGPVACAPKQAG
jgi:hypothetical protein